MSNQTWAQLGNVSNIAAALGGAFGEAGKVFGGSFGSTLGDIGSIAGSLGRVGGGIAAAGAFSGASRDQQTSALVAASPIVSQMVAAQSSVSPAQVKDAQVVRKVETRQETVTGGVFDALGELLAIPFKLLDKFFA